MAVGRHRLVVEKPSSRRLLRIAIPVSLATAVTGGVVGAAIAWPNSGPNSGADAGSDPASGSDQRTSAPSSVAAQSILGATDRGQQISRSAERVVLRAKPTPAKPTPAEPTPAKLPSPPAVTGHLFLTTDLNVWTGPGESFKLVRVLVSGSKVAVTGRQDGGWAQIVRGGAARWVNAAYLSETKPGAELSAARVGGLSGAACASGSSIESAITANAVALHRAVCAQFPQITTYGGWRGDGEHSDGRAIDIMVSGSLGQQVADWVRANAAGLQVSDVIWSQHIWTVQRGSEGWRAMSDRGSTTANHYDHVHVQVY